MTKKKDINTSRQSKTPSAAVAAEHKVRAAKNSSEKEMVEEIKAEEPKFAEVIPEESSKAEISETVKKAPPETEPLEVAADKPQMVEPAETVAEEPQTVAPAEAATEEPQMAAPAETVADEPQTVAPEEAAADEPQPVAPAEAATEEPQMAAPAETVADEPQPVGPAEAAAEEPQPVEPAEAVAEEPQMAAPSETVAEEPQTVAPAEAVAEEPQPVAPAEAIAEEPQPVEPAEAAAEEPQPVAPAEAAAEEPQMAAPAEAAAEEPQTAAPMEAAMPEEAYVSPRRSVAFIGSECYPFVKTGGLGDVMFALPKALVKQNCDVKVILPRYKCIPWEYQQKMIYRGSFEMDLCADGRSFYVGIMEYVWDGVVYDFIDNEEFFSAGNPYTNLVDDIPKYCFFAKAALAALNYMDWIPNIIHCHDWQAALVPVYLRTQFVNTKLTAAKTILTIHNLRFQGIYNIPTIRYWSGLPEYVFNKDALKTGYTDANMLKGGLAYANIITTVSQTYAGEIQSAYYGETLDAHLRYHSGKLRGIVNGIDYDIWNPYTDSRLYANYDITNVLDKKKENKRKLQEELGLVQDDHKFVMGLISRLTDQKGLDLVNTILPHIMDGHTQIVVLGTGDRVYEDSFRYYEYTYKGNVCSNIMYDETRAHRIYAGADALLVPSRFEPCGLTQLIAMHYGTVPIVRETGGLKDTVEPYNMYSNTGNGFTFDRYEAGLLLDAINRAKTFYFENRWCWDEMVQRDMDKNLSWENSAKQYKDLYLDLTR